MAKNEDILKAFSKAVDAVNKVAEKAGVKPAKKETKKQQGKTQGKNQKTSSQPASTYLTGGGSSKINKGAPASTYLTGANPIAPRLTRADGSTWESGKPLPAVNRSKLLGGDSAVMLPDNRKPPAALPLPYAPRSDAEQKLVQNSLKWHTAKTAEEKNALFQENERIRRENNWRYDPTTGTTHSGHGNLSEPVQMLHRANPAQRAQSFLAGQAGMKIDEFQQMQREAARSAGVVSRLADTVDASTKRVAGGLDNAFATSTLAGAVKAEQKFLQGETLGFLDKIKLKNRWGDNWEEYLTSVKKAYENNDQKAIEEYEQRVRQIASLYDTSPKLDAAARQAERAKAGLGSAGSTALDLLGMGADMAGYASIASTGGGGSTLFTGVSSIGAAGHAGDQARKMGADVIAQNKYANAVGAVNFAVESLGGIGANKYVGNAIDRVLPQGIKDLAAKVGSTAVGRVVGGAAEEGFEGGLQSEIERHLRNQILNANEAFDPARLLADVGSNAFMGAVFRGGQEISRAIAPRLTRADGSPGLNVDSAAAETYNQLNEGGGADGQGQVDHRGGRNGLPQDDFGSGMAENAADFRGIKRSGAEIGPLAEGDRTVYRSDSERRSISPEISEKLSGTAVADSEGRPVSVYHSTPDMEFETFDQGDVGFHFGSERQAAKRQEQKGAGRTIRAYLNLKNPYRANADIMNWHADAAAMKLWADGVITDAEANHIYDLSAKGLDYHSEASNALREVLSAKGYDGISYPNGFESEGDSYIAFYPEQVVIADDGKSGGSQNTPGGGKGAGPESPFGKNTVGAAELAGQTYATALEEYGQIKPGENPARDVEVPQSMDGKTRVSQFARTLMEAPATPEEFLPAYEQQVENGLWSHDVKTDKDALDNAVRVITRHGYQGALERWQQVVDGERLASKDDIVLAQVLYAEAAHVGDAQTAMKLAGEIAAEGTRAGQAVQALRLLKKATPEGKLYYARKSVDQLQSELTRKYGNEAPNLKIDEDIAAEFLNAQTDEARDAALDKLYDHVAAQLPTTFGDRLNAWRYFAMLGNPRTHIRNIVGNIAFQAPVRAKNKVGAVLEKAFVPKEQRTKSVLRNKAAKEFAKADYAEMADTLGGNKYTDVQEIKSRKKLFPAPLQKAMDANSAALDIEDAFFKKQTYINSMAEFLTARGVDVKNMDTNTLEQARSYARQEALKATFQDASAAANALSRLEKQNKATELLIGGLVPFKRTPINIVKRGIEYSPVGLVKGITYDLAQVRKGTKTATQAIDSISAGLTGTALSVLGAFLASQGLVSGEGDENDKKRNFEAAQGSQEYALNIGDYTYTIDWAAPAALPLFVGVEAWNAMQEKNEGLTLSTAIDSVEKIMGPAFNLTMLDGVSGALKSASYAKENPISAVATNTLQNFAGQVVPTLFGQIARTLDDTRRTTYHDKNSPLPQSLDTFLQRQANKIPGLSKNQPAYTDVWGRPDKTENVLRRALENFFSPGYISKKLSSEAEDAIGALYDATGDAAVLPAKPQKYVVVNGEKKWLTAEQYLAAAKTKGDEALSALNGLVKSAAYQSMTDEERAAAVKDIYDYASALAANKVSYKPLEGTVMNVRESGVEPGLYFGYKEKLDSLNESMESYEARDELFRTLRNDASLTEKQRNQLYDTLLIKGVSDSQYEKYKAIGDKVTKEEYIDAMIQKQFLDAAGEDIQSGRATIQATEFSKYLDTMGYEGEKRMALENTFKFFNMFPAESKNYTYDMLAQSGSKDEQKYSAELESTGITAPEYLQIKTLAGKATYEKGVSGAKLAAQAAVVSENVENYEQYSAVMRMLGYKKIDGHYAAGGKRKPVEESAIEPRAVNAENRWTVNPVSAPDARMISDYGERDAPKTTYAYGSKFHYGIDIGAKERNLNGEAAGSVGDGTVDTVGYDPEGYGNYVIIDHENGYRTLYGHLQKATVKQGQTVRAGQQIGVIGGTGNVEAPHLHLSAWKNGEPIDPATMIPGF